MPSVTKLSTLHRAAALAASACALAAAPLAMAQGTVLYDIDFSAPKHTLDATPATGGVDGVSRISRGTSKVVASVGPLVDRPLLFSGADVNSEIELSADPGASIYQLDFEVATENLKGSDYRFYLTLDTGFSPSVVLNGVSGQLELSGHLNNELPRAVTWVEGEAMQFSITANFSTGRWTAMMNQVVVFDATFAQASLRSFKLGLERRLILLEPGDDSVKVGVDYIRVLSSPAVSLDRPVGLSATVAPDRSHIDLDWADTPGALSYRVFRTDSLTGPITLLAETATSSYQDAEVIPGYDYNYWVVAKSGPVLSSASTSVWAFVNLDPPSSLTLKPRGDGQAILLSWPAAEGAARYMIYRGEVSFYQGEPVSLGTYLATVSDLQFEDTTVSPGTRYMYRVRSLVRTTPSITGASAIGMSALLAPGGFEATKNLYSGKILLAWDPVEEADYYTIYRGDSDVFGEADLLGESDTTEYEDSTAVNGREYSYWVVAGSIEGVPGIPSASALGSAINGQPDLWIRRGADAWVGEGTVNATGAGQSIIATTRHDKPVKATIGVESVGAPSDEFKVRGSGGDNRFEVSYRYEGNATAGVISGRLVVPSSAELRELEVSVDPGSRLRRSPRKQSKAVLVRGTSTLSPSQGDTVIFKILSLPLPVPDKGWSRPDPSARTSGVGVKAQ